MVLPVTLVPFRALTLKGDADGVDERGVQPGWQALASGSETTQRKISDIATGKELLDLKGHAGASRAWRSARTVVPGVGER